MQFVFRLSDVLKLNLQVDRGTDFAAWRTQWKTYVYLSGLSEESVETKIQALNLSFSHETLMVVNNLGLTTEQKKDIDPIIICSIIDGHRNKSMKRIIATFWNIRAPNEDRLCHAILQYRNTPSCKDGLSPAQKLYDRPIPPIHQCSLPQNGSAVPNRQSSKPPKLCNNQSHNTVRMLMAYLICKRAPE